MFGKLILITSICLAGGYTHHRKISNGENTDVVIPTSEQSCSACTITPKKVIFEKRKSWNANVKLSKDDEDQEYIDACMELWDSKGDLCPPGSNSIQEYLSYHVSTIWGPTWKKHIACEKVQTCIM